MALKIAVSLLAGYLLGNFNAGIILSRLVYRKDIREHGSKNPGSTNMFRVLGKVAGLLCLVFDAFKGVLAVWLANALLNGTPFALGDTTAQWWACAAAFLVTIGHIYPVCFHFKGGKGVATTGGTQLALHPAVVGICVVPFLVILIGTRYMSLASMTVGFLLAGVTLLWNAAHGVPLLTPVFWLCLAQALLFLFTHRANIKRLAQHKENRLDFKRRTPPESSQEQEPQNG